MFDEFRLRDIARRKGLKIKEIAKLIGISNTTMHRKLSGMSDFSRAEIEKLSGVMSDSEIKEIFFAQEVSRCETKR